MAHQDPLVTVVVPAYNAERFLERTLRSALQQTYRNIEVVVVDDGSTDATRRLAADFTARDGRARVISTSNQGVASARNTGIEAAKGSFVAFLDADDLWHPAKIELQIAALLESGGGDAAAAYAFHVMIDADDWVRWRSSGFGCSGYAFARLLYGRLVGNGSSLLVRRDVALAVGGFDPGWAAAGASGCEDFDFELKIAAKHPIVAVPRFLVGYRITAGNMSSNTSRMARAITSVAERHIALNPALPSWVANKARAGIYEYILCIFLGDRRWGDALSAFAKIVRFDPLRGLDFAARLLGRKIARLFDAGRHEPERLELFESFDPARVPPLQSRVSRDRDIALMKRLAKVDDAMAGQHGVTQWSSQPWDFLLGATDIPLLGRASA